MTYLLLIGLMLGTDIQMAPDGTYVGGRPEMAPDGSYVGIPEDGDSKEGDDER